MDQPQASPSSPAVKAAGIVPKASPWAASLLTLAGVLVLCLAFLQMPGFRWLGPFTSDAHFWGLLLLGLALAGYGLYSSSEERPSGDLNRPIAYSLLGIVFLAAGYLELDHLGRPFSGFWADSAIVVSDIPPVIDMHEFHLVFPAGARPPFYSYICALVWWLFPALKGMVMQRVAACLVSFTTFWLLYRLGREVSGRRTVGVLLAALGAASKAYLIQVITGYGGLSLVFAVTLVLYTQFRLLKEQTLARCLQWGAALALALHTYTSAVPWFPFLALFSVGLFLWKERRSAVEKQALFAVPVFLVAYLLFYVDHMASVLHDNPISRLWAMNGFVWLLIQAAFLAGFVHGYQRSSEASRRLYSLGFGLLLFGVLCHPLAMNGGGAGRIAEQSLLPKTLGGYFSVEFFKTMKQQIEIIVMYIFRSGGERSDMNVLGDPFFTFQEVILLVLGLLYAVLRPTKTKSFLLLCALVGTIPYLLTGDHQSAKFSGVLVPALLLGCLAADHCLRTLWAGPSTLRWTGVAFAVFLAGFWVWEVSSVHQRVYVKWWTEVQNDDVCVGNEVDKVLPGNRVYLAPVTVAHNGHFFDCSTQAVLHDDQSIYLLNDKNPILLWPNEKRKDVTVIVSPLMKDLVKKLKKEFPSSTWVPAWQYYQQSHDEVPFLYSVTIPASAIPDKSGKLFQFQTIPQGSWRRMIYFYRLCFRGGVIQTEDSSATLNPVPANAPTHPLSAMGEWEAPADGKYRFSMNSGECTRVTVDGETILTSLQEDKSRSLSKRISLKKGIHVIRIATYLITRPTFVDITVENPDLNYKVVLGSTGN